ncbi:DivIVA domain-containing protein [bacterium]|nr:DivIVA domain-containing protein [bacterium]
MLTPGEIRDKDFKASFRGYDSREVQLFLELVADEMELLNEENKRLKQVLQKKDDELEDFYAKEETLHNALLSTQKFIDQQKDEARKEAENLVLNAQTEARKKVQKEIQEVERLQKQKDILIQENAQFRQRLRYLINEHLELLSRLDQEDKNESASK